MKDNANQKLHIWGKITSFDTSYESYFNSGQTYNDIDSFTFTNWVRQCCTNIFALKLYFSKHIFLSLKRDMWRQMNLSIIGYLDQTEKGLVCLALFSPARLLLKTFFLLKTTPTYKMTLWCVHYKSFTNIYLQISSSSVQVLKKTKHPILTIQVFHG